MLRSERGTKMSIAGMKILLGEPLKVGDDLGGSDVPFPPPGLVWMYDPMEDRSVLMKEDGAEAWGKARKPAWVKVSPSTPAENPQKGNG